MILKSRRSGIILNFIMAVNPGFHCIKEIRGGVRWYMMESWGFISTINFKLRNGN